MALLLDYGLIKSMLIKFRGPKSPNHHSSKLLKTHSRRGTRRCVETTSSINHTLSYLSPQAGVRKKHPLPAIRVQERDKDRPHFAHPSGTT
jgi:hypothetical protein